MNHKLTATLLIAAAVLTNARDHRAGVAGAASRPIRGARIPRAVWR